MKTLKAILAISMFTVSSFAMSAGFDRDPGRLIEENQRAMEAYAAELGKPAPKVEKYRFGMDGVFQGSCRVNRVFRLPFSAAAVPAPVRG